MAAYARFFDGTDAVEDHIALERGRHQRIGSVITSRNEVLGQIPVPLPTR